MPFFDTDDIARLKAERQRKESEAARAAQEKQAAEDAAKALALREAAALQPYVKEALGEFVGLAKQLGTKSSTCPVFADNIFGTKTKYGRQQVKFDVCLWSLFYANWPDGSGTVYIDDHGRTYVGDVTVNRMYTYRTTGIFQYPRDEAVQAIARSIRARFYDKNKECPKGFLLDPQRAKDTVQSAFMELLRKE